MRTLLILTIISVCFGLFVTSYIKPDTSPALVTALDHKNKIAYVELHPVFVTGSDGACQGAGMVILEVLRILPNGWKVYVTNPWVPSKHNPIDIDWAEKLAEGY